MNDKDFKDCIDNLVKATDSLSNIVDKMGRTIDKMVDYCVIVSLVMFSTVVIAFIF